MASLRCFFGVRENHLQTLTQGLSDTFPANIGEHARKRRNDLGRYRYIKPYSIIFQVPVLLSLVIRKGVRILYIGFRYPKNIPSASTGKGQMSPFHIAFVYFCERRNKKYKL